jgi:hypothetical protein
MYEIPFEYFLKYSDGGCCEKTLIGIFLSPLTDSTNR